MNKVKTLELAMKTIKFLEETGAEEEEMLVALKTAANNIENTFNTKALMAITKQALQNMMPKKR